MADKALFEQTLQSDPESGGAFESHRFAFGKAGTNTLNITLAQFKTWLQTALTAWLRKDQNLADLPNKATARNNLSVYSRDETYTRDDIDLIALGINNKFGGLEVGLIAGVEADGTIHKYGGSLSATCNRDGSLVYTITHNRGGNYIVFVTKKNDEYFKGMVWNANDFTISFNDHSLNKYAQEFYFIMYLI